MTSPHTPLKPSETISEGILILLTRIETISLSIYYTCEVVYQKWSSLQTWRLAPGHLREQAKSLHPHAPYSIVTTTPPIHPCAAASLCQTFDHHFHSQSLLERLPLPRIRPTVSIKDIVAIMTTTDTAPKSTPPHHGKQAFSKLPSSSPISVQHSSSAA